MTTPEKLRRRQRREGWAVVFLGISVVVTSFVNEQRDDDQDQEFRTCIADQFGSLDTYLGSRSNITERNNTAIDDAFEGAATSIKTQSRSAIEKALRDYGKTRDKIKIDRAATTLPKFPSGKCD